MLASGSPYLGIVYSIFWLEQDKTDAYRVGIHVLHIFHQIVYKINKNKKNKKEKRKKGEKNPATTCVTG
jgi:hypothetical protein